MIKPYWFTLARPGFMIPVFFLSFLTITGQPAWQESYVSSAGGAFVSRQGTADARYNQAGLGWLSRHTVSLQHAQPYSLSELCIASLAVQVPAGKGGFGAVLSSCGIQGYRQNSCWISYGLKLHPAVSAGLGIQILNTSAGERFFFHSAVSCAIGIQVKLNEDFCLAGHVMHPVAWSDLDHGLDSRKMMISAGFSYTFFASATYHGDLHLSSSGHLQWCQGLEIPAAKKLIILVGMHNHPPALSGGLSLQYHHWSVTLAMEYCFDTGLTPSSTITYAW